MDNALPTGFLMFRVMRSRADAPAPEGFFVGALHCFWRRRALDKAIVEVTCNGSGHPMAMNEADVSDGLGNGDANRRGGY